MKKKINLMELKKDLGNFANQQKALSLARFFKTGKGQYGEGDVFLGIRVPESKKIARKYKLLPEEDVLLLLKSPFHEERLVALFILVFKFSDGGEETKKKIFDLYLANTRYINNWDLVDLSSDKIAGAFLYGKPKDKIYELACSQNLWEKRISIMATFNFIKKGCFNETFKIASILLTDNHDLIHKAVGWMLREVGKRCSQEALEDFLRQNYKVMPRTMLRYAIERFPQDLRLRYLKGDI